jgi:class 3 adenylate cyclase
MFTELDLKRAMAGDLHNLANIYNNLNQHEKAISYYRTALDINESVGNTSWAAKNLGGLSTMYRLRGDFDVALEYAQRSLALIESIKDPTNTCLALFYLGQVHEDAGQYADALAHYERSLDTAIAARTRHVEISARASIGALLGKEDWDGKNLEQAESITKRCIDEFDELGAKQQVNECYFTLSRIYEQMGRWEDALLSYRRHVELRNEVVNEDLHTKAQQHEQFREQAEREKEVAVAQAAASARKNATVDLLNKVLPERIAERIIAGERVADYFSSVSILFADIVGFTTIAARMPAKAVLGVLNHVFGEFDRIMEKHGCEKIKTMGDGYLAVAGLPTECTDHAERLTRAALDMMSVTKLPDHIISTLPRNTGFEIRIGIHTGSCFAGIVGEQRFVYDVYSDAVNVAARMESNGEPGRITVSEDFAFHLQNRLDLASDETLNHLTFVERDEIAIKGKGLMKTYFIERAALP